jgi:hypothetical protein
MKTINDTTDSDMSHTTTIFTLIVNQDLTSTITYNYQESNNVKFC